MRVYGNKHFAIPSFRYIIPIALCVCLLTTIIFVCVLSKRVAKGSSMSRASCILLLSIAAADGLTMIFAIAEVVFLYTNASGNELLLPLKSCSTMLILERLSAIPHAASTWLTVVLAVQRYICVCFPFDAKKVINVRQSTVYVLVVALFSVGLHGCRFFDTKFVVVNLESSSENGVLIETCQARYRSWVENPVLYESLFAWIRIVITQLLPCLSLLVFVVLMLKGLWQTRRATKDEQLQGVKQLSERRRISRVVVVISSVVICVELSSATFLSFNVLEISKGSVIFRYETLKAVSLGFDLLLYISYFFIFVLYCFMSGTFRKTVTAFCTVRARDKNKSNEIPEIIEGKTSKFITSFTKTGTLTVSS